jgi:type IV pilus assembly protein PilN
MAKINLLPWRAARRKQRQQEFLTLLGFAAVAAIVLSLLIVMYYNGQIDGQTARNQYLTDQIAIVDKQIDEIKELDKKKEGLLRRKKVIEDLQSNRSMNVHLFDELVRTIPDGVRLSALNQNGNQLSLEGFAQSNARVSTYMRNLQASGWLTKPVLSIIQVAGDDKGLPYKFNLTVTLQNPNDAANAAAAAAGEAPPVAAVAMPASTGSMAMPAAATPAPAAATTSAAAAAKSPNTPPATKMPTTPPAAAASTGGKP